MPKPMKRLDKEVQNSANWFATWLGGPVFEVAHYFTGEKYVVNLQNQSCTCNFQNLVRIPCCHTVCAIRFLKGNYESYVHRYYKKDFYEICFEQIITPINGPQMWPRAKRDGILPQSYKQGHGRQNDVILTPKGIGQKTPRRLGQRYRRRPQGSHEPQARFLGPWAKYEPTYLCAYQIRVSLFLGLVFRAP